MGGWCRLCLQSSDGLVQSKNFLLLAAEPADRDGAGLRLALAHHQKRRDLGEAVLADLVGDLLVAQIRLDPESPGGSDFGHLASIGIGVARYGEHRRLDRRQPERKAAGILLDQNRDETLHRTQDGTVQHYRTMTLAILADVAGIEA